MESIHSSTRQVLLRLLLVAAVAVSHCCLLGQTAHAAGVHADAGSMHGAAAGVAGFECERSPGAHMDCEGAHALASARVALPAPGPAVAGVAPVPTATPAHRSAPSRPVLPERSPPSRAVLQTYLI